MLPPGHSNILSYQEKLNSFYENLSYMQPLIIIKDERFTQHLENVPHLENAKRVKAIESVFDTPFLKGKWKEAVPRLASVGSHVRSY
jgi:hypothetical protein